MLKVTPIPVAAVGAANILAALGQSVQLAATSVCTTITPFGGIDPTSIEASIKVSGVGLEAQPVLLDGVKKLFDAGTDLTVTAPLYAAVDDWGFSRFI